MTTPLEDLERAIQTFVDTSAEPGVVTDWFIAIGYTRIDEDGDQPFSRRYVSGSNPYGSVGVAELCLSDCRADLSDKPQP